MRIALFPGSFLPRMGGVEIATHNLALRLAARGHFVVVLTWWGFWRKLPKRVPYLVLPLLPRTFAWESLQLWKGFGKKIWLSNIQITLLQILFRFDIWHAHMAFPAAALLSNILPKMRVPYIITCHGGDIATLPEIHYGLRLNVNVDMAVHSAMQTAAAVIAISHLMRNKIREIMPNEQKIVNIPNGIDTDFFLPAPTHSEKNKLLHQPWNILSVSRGDKVKNTALIVEIATVLKARGFPFKWAVIGRGNEDLKRKAIEQGVANEIIIHSEMTAVEPSAGPGSSAVMLALRDSYRRADVVVVPSFFESFSLVALEALACGTPVVASRNCGCCDLIQSGKNGYCAVSDDAEDFATKIVKLCATEGNQINGKGVAAYVASICSWNIILTEHEKLYHQVLKDSLDSSDE